MKPILSPQSYSMENATDEPLNLNAVSYHKKGYGRQKLQDSTSVSNTFEAAIYGVVVAIVLCPCMIGYCAIIFSDPIYKPYMPQLIKLVFISSIVHQSWFSFRSPLNFAIGQVQDAGLIFLSTMSASIIQRLSSTGVPAYECVTTVLVHLSLSTLCVGLALMITGRLKLASVVQYLPMPVVGGYLAYIGLFTLQAGVALMTGLVLNGPLSWVKLLSLKPILLSVPGLIFGIGLILVSSKFHHFAVLPSCLLSIPILFYVILLASGSSLDDAQSYGWVGESSPSITIWKVWGLFDFQYVHWSVMLTQIPTWCGMYFVISFSSSLDIAAIIMGTGNQLDYNEQLVTVGMSNFFSGLTGGYTGSYIFSQTLFAFRTKTNSKVTGMTLALCELVLVFLPFSIMSYIPKYFFGSVMVFIGVDLLVNWLIRIYFKMLFREFVIVVASFVMIIVFGVEGGMMFGIGFSAFSFIYEYSKVGVVKEVLKYSNVVRNLEQRDILCPHHRQIVTIELHGHIFFGSSIQILNGVKKAVKILNPKKANFARVYHSKHSEELPLLPIKYSETIVCLDGSKASVDSLVTKFLVIDFAHVSGVDATAVRSCFLTLKLLANVNKVRTVYVNLTGDMERLLRSNDVVSPNDPNTQVFDDLDKGLEWAEELLIVETISQTGPKRGKSLWGVHMATLPEILQDCFGLPESCKGLDLLAPFFVQEDFRRGEKIFAVKAPTGSFYVLVEGEVTLNTLPVEKIQSTQRCPMDLLRRVHSGCIFGDLDFFLEQPRSMEAVVTSVNATVYKMTRASMNKLEITYPHLVILVQNAILRSSLLVTKENIPALVT